MSVITELKKVGASEKYRVFVNHEFAFFACLEVLYKMQIKEGQKISEKDLETLKFESEKILAFTQSLALTTKALKTTKQVRDYLHKKGYNKQAQNHAVEKLKGYGYLNDLEYAARFVEQAKQTKGKNLIRQQLFQKGISRDVIEQATASLNQNQDAFNVGQKYLKNKEKTQQNKQRVYRHLTARGFLYSEVASAVKKLFDGDFEDDWY